MNVERAREFMLGLPHVVETEQWGGVVYWVGDKAIGGKMFCMMNPDSAAGGACSFAAGEERFHELVEREGLIPAPYMARIFWVAAEDWGALRDAEWRELLEAAHTRTMEKLAPRVKAVLAMPKTQQQKLIAEARKKIVAKAAAKKAAKA